MRCPRWILGLFLTLAAAMPASAQQRLIVRDQLGADALRATCQILDCAVQLSLGDPSGQLFVVTVDDAVNLSAFLKLLSGQLGVFGAEVDQQLFLVEGVAGPIPESLTDNTPIAYYGS